MPLFQFEHFLFDSHKGELTCDGEKRLLRFKAGQLLSYLIAHRDRVISKDELLDSLWQQGEYRENSLTQCIGEVRKLLGDKAANPSFIKTYQQRGYQWICPVTEIPEPVTSPVDREGETSGSASEQDGVLVSDGLRKRPYLTLGLFCVLVVISLVLYWQPWQETDIVPVEQSDNPATLMVLPFINQTDDASMDWLELGLADMIASELEEQSELALLPPDLSNALLSGHGVSWPPLSMDIQALLTQQDVKYALRAGVRLHHQQQVLDFQIISADGRIQQGAITYLSLAQSTRAIASQLLHLIEARGNEVLVVSASEQGQPHSIASQSLAEGLQTTYTQGHQASQRFFQAASLLAPQDLWPALYLARAQIMTGQWQEAGAQLKGLSSRADLTARQRVFIHYWLAELAFRRGEDINLPLEQAFQLVSGISDQKLKAAVFRLKARIAWQQQRWQEHEHWIQAADRLFPRENDLRLEAEKLFYLGDPTAQGPDKDPQTDLVLNQTRLTQALNFYKQLENQPMVAASQFAIAQNYHNTVERRQAALDQAITLYQKLNQPYELASALTYKGFILIQLRKGEQAQAPLSHALQISQRLGATPLSQNIRFYLGFALLDQGLDQSAFGRHPENPVVLKRAIAAFEELLPELPEGISKANTQFMLGWAWSDAGDDEQALRWLTQAEDTFESHGLATSASYSRYSQMHIHLKNGAYQAALAIPFAHNEAKLAYNYRARALYESGDFNGALSTLESLADALPEQWQGHDQARLKAYQQAVVSGEFTPLSNELPAHAIYCEFDWNLTELTGQPD